MAGTIVVDRIESDASYPSSINVAGQIVFSNTVNFGVFTGTAPVSGFYLPSTNNLAFTTASTERMRFTTSSVVFNDGGADFDFRVEGDTNASLLFVDAGNDRVGIGTSSPSYKLEVFEPSAGNNEFTGLSLVNYDYGVGETGQSVSIQGQVRNDGGGVSPLGKITFGKDSDYSSAANRDGNIQFSVNNSNSLLEAMRIDSSGNLLVGVTSGSFHIIQKTTATSGDQIISIQGTAGFGSTFEVFAGYNSALPNAANAITKIGQMGGSGRSLNAAGTVNASGSDYAEYMTKAGEFDFAKGDVCGVNADGKLTNVFADAVAFVVKSTNPSYVGGDTWGNDEAVGRRPIKPTQNAAEVDEEGNETQAAETDEDFAARMAQYESDLAEFEAKLEAERQKVDRIAFSGQVPVNVTGATAGQYIVPVESNGGITGLAVNEADMTLAQYMKAVGKVIAIEDDGRARIIVKVA